MKKILIFLVVLSIFILINPLNIYSENSILARYNIKIYYFYSNTCKECLKLDSYLRSLEEKYPEIKIEKYELSNNSSNIELFYNFLNKYNIQVYSTKYYQVPAIFIGEYSLIGSSDIKNNIEEKISFYLNNNYDDPMNEIVNENDLADTKGIYLQNFLVSIPIVVLSALVDSINPCAFAVIIFLITTLMLMNGKKNVIKLGSIYIFTIFIFYFISGFGLIFVIEKIRMPKIFYLIIGIILILWGLINIKDYFWYNRWLKLEIPKSSVGLIVNLLKKSTLISTFSLGLLVGIIEVPCSGGVYLGLISIISSMGVSLKTFILLLLYNLIFILPLVIIVILFYYSFSLEKIHKWKEKNKKNSRLVTGILLILMGMYFLIWF